MQIVSQLSPFPTSSYGMTKIVVLCQVANPLVTFTLHLVGEVQLATADGGWTSREVLNAKVIKLLTSKAGSRRIDKEGTSSLLSAASDMAWRNT